MVHVVIRSSSQHFSFGTILPLIIKIAVLQAVQVPLASLIIPPSNGQPVIHLLQTPFSNLVPAGQLTFGLPLHRLPLN